MATSGSFDFTRTRDQIIERALRAVGALGQGEVATAPQITEGSEVLNSIVKALQAEPGGPRLWVTEKATVTGLISSEITHNGVNYICILGHTSSIAGATGDEPGVGDAWTNNWQTGGAGGPSWATATAYVSAGDFGVAADTIDIQRVFVRDSTATSHGNDVYLRMISREEYMGLYDKGDTGEPTHIYFDKQLIPRAYLYPQSDNSTYVIHYDRIRLLEDFDASGDTPDFPVRWIETLVFMLAYKLSFEYSLPLQERGFLRSEAERLKSLSKMTDEETTDTQHMTGAY